MKKPALFFLFTLAAIALFGAHASRAETFHTCKGFITSVPAVITQQGVWCMDRDLATAIESGPAISIATNNVTIDCNGFKLGGLAAGADTFATGISAIDRLNVTVRNCAVRGFFVGIGITGGGGHLVEGNRFDGNTLLGISIGNDPSVNGTTIRGNTLLDTGGTVNNNTARAIEVNAPVDIIDNLIDGVHPGTMTAPDGSVAGISINYGKGARVSGNRVRGLAPTGNGTATGLLVFGDEPVLLSENVLLGAGAGAGYGIGISCGGTQPSAKDNFIGDFVEGLSNCSDDGGNVIRLPLIP